MTPLWLATVFMLAGTGQATIDLAEGWRFSPDAQNAGITEKWFDPTYADDKWATLSAGARWESLGYPELDGAAWYRKRVDIPGEWAGKKIWLVMGGVNDSYVLYCNGRQVAQYGDESVCSAYETATVSDLSSYLEVGKPNLLAIRVFDWGGNGGLWRLPCRLTCDPAQLLNVPELAGYISYDERKFTIEVKLKGLQRDRGDAKLQIDVYRDGENRPFTSRTLNVSSRQFWATATFEFPHLRRDEKPWRVQAVATDAHGTPLGNPLSSIEIKLLSRPSWPAPYEKLKVLNNFVTELLNERGVNDVTREFSNPREGWIFLSLSGQKRTAAREVPNVYLDERSEFLCLRRNPDNGAYEAMAYLPEGKHALRVQHAGASTLIVRAIPQLGFHAYPAAPLIKEHGVYDWPYVERYILPHVNAIVGGASGSPEFAQWVREGRKWIASCPLPGMNSETPPSVDAVIAPWMASPGTAEPQYHGIIVDEFVENAEGNYKAWAKAVRHLRTEPRFTGKMFYGYCGNFYPSPDESSMALYRTVLDCGYRFALERYLREEPTLESTRLSLLKKLQHTHNAWTKAFPGFERQLVMNLGYLSAPPETSNVNPGTNYLVFSDMQLRLLATDPTFWGLFGVMEYGVGYADEETLRWVYRLFRHYCIEGARTPLTNDPYILPHVENPDFADGLQGWNVASAVEGSIRTKQMAGFGWLQGRFQNVDPPSADGDQFLWMKRSADKPNTVSQTMKKLQPGRLYSLKLITADLGNLDKEQRLAVSVHISDADIQEKGSFQSVFRTCYSHIGQFGITSQAWMNYHRILFRPRNANPEVTISDWLHPDAPEGPIGQELAINFVEVQPFFEP